MAPLSAVRLSDGPFLAAQDRGRGYLLSLDADRLLAPFLREAGLGSRAESYGNWESAGLDGHMAGHCLSALSFLVASTGDEEARRRLAYMVGELAQAQKYLGTGYLGGIPRSEELWDEVRRGVSSDTFSRDGRWVPWYNLHKTYAGLLDAHTHAATPGALEVLRGIAEWWENLAETIDEKQFQTMLATEFGGMSDVYATLWRETGDERHLRMAQRFTRIDVIQPLSAGIDQLTGMHANTQIAQMVGVARLATALGDEDWLTAAKFFWDSVVQRRSVSIGGNSVREHFHDVKDFTAMVEDREGPESCNTYNMLKLSEILFLASDDTAYIDYVERAELNHLLSTQHPKHGGLVYFTPMRPGHYRRYSRIEECHWCCVGTGLETHAKHGRLLYALREKEVTVLQFAASTLEWAERDIRLIQTTAFPYGDSTRLRFHLRAPQVFALRVRRPEWLSEELVVRLNGEPVAGATERGYLIIRRRWRDGDLVDVDLHRDIRVDRLPDGSDWIALRYGPTVLSSRTGRLDGLEQIADSARAGHIATGSLTPLAATPVITPRDIEKITVTDAGRLTFRVPTSAGETILEPFADIHDTRYITYFPFAGDGDVARRWQVLAARDTAALSLDGRTVDVLVFGEQQPETDHLFWGNGLDSGVDEDGQWRSTEQDLSFILRDVQAAGVVLRVEATASKRFARFDVEIDDTIARPIQSDGLPAANSANVAIEYRVPAALPGLIERRICVRAAPGSWTGRLRKVRLMR